MNVEKSYEWFTGHFTHPLYTDEAAELGPFGNDTGADFFSEWEERGYALRSSTTVRYLLAKTVDGDVDAFLAEGEQGDIEELDEVLIAAGFTLLRLTRQIDSEGLSWTRAALSRARERYGSVEADIMLSDLARLVDPNTPIHPVVQELHAQRRSGRRRTPWLFTNVFPPEPEDAPGWKGAGSGEAPPAAGLAAPLGLVPPAVKALERAGQMLDHRLAPWGESIPETPWSKWADEHFGTQWMFELRLLPIPGRSRRLTIRKGNNEDWIASLTFDLDRWDALDPAKATVLVREAYEAAVRKWVAKAAVPPPPPLPPI
ncbi:hypothetical protein [Auraticoccus monumenti]|uniref:Uncharacterized conserved protein YfeS, contains WGR domain n=1 Tax=Auraticoccus monumenti TaxID=675864 RepID=A0A1G6YLD5_9ACTN|nr:hypothetical protein [Auraticoccus monumenti]SDD91111.1 Uncharacterized conserved protein YfeS, contains WGR domain [Auraticoccus monumenti]